MFGAVNSIGSDVSLVKYLFPVLVWSLIWKGLALYKSARKEQKIWFVTLLVVHTVGILDIVYLLFFSDKKSAQNK